MDKLIIFVFGHVSGSLTHSFHEPRGRRPQGPVAVVPDNLNESSITLYTSV